MAAPPQQPRAYSQAYLPNGNPSGTASGAGSLLPNQGRVIQASGARVLCIADVRGNLRSLNDLARSARADYIIHTGDFGFYDESSLERIAERTLKHVAEYSQLLSGPLKQDLARAPSQPSIKERFQRERLPLSELPLFLNGSYRLEVPVYTVWGACEDVSVLEKLRSGEYKIDNLHVIDEGHSRLLEIGGVKLRLLGLGGAVVPHKLFDNGEGRTTIAGGQGTMWTTLLQMGELIDTANRVYDPTETRIFITHASPTIHGLLNQLAVTLKADFSISGGLHFRYGSSYNEFSVNPSLDHYRGKLAAAKASFNDVWETVKHEVEPAVADTESQQRLLAHALEVVNKMPSVAGGGNPFGAGSGPAAGGQVDESAFKNMWNFNLADAAFGWLVLEIDQGRIGTEMRAQGFNFSHRGKPSTQRPNAGPIPSSQEKVLPSHQVQRGVPQLASQNISQLPAQPPQRQPAPPTAPQAPRSAQPTPSAAPTKPAASPQPPAANGTPAPSATTTTNGTTPAPADKSAESPRPKAQEPPATAIYVPALQEVADDDEMKNLVFAEQDRARIKGVDKTPKGFWVVRFESPDIVNEVLKRGPPSDSRYNTLKLQPYRPRGGRGGAPFGASWGSTRGGAAGVGPASSPAGGYRSSGASDSEGGRGGRGRGGFRGSRGDRGRGRGGRGGAGPGRTDSGSAPASASASTPAPPSTPAAGGS